MFNLNVHMGARSGVKYNQLLFTNQNRLTYCISNNFFLGELASRKAKQGGVCPNLVQLRRGGKLGRWSQGTAK